jgi:hypothetical protein
MKKEKIVMKRTSIRRKDWYETFSDTGGASIENGVMQMGERSLHSYLELKKRYENWFAR